MKKIDTGYWCTDAQSIYVEFPRTATIKAVKVFDSSISADGISFIGVGGHTLATNFTTGTQGTTNFKQFTLTEPYRWNSIKIVISTFRLSTTEIQIIGNYEP